MALTQVSTAGVKDDAVTSGKIPANAVGSSELADNAVDTAAIAANAVTNPKIVSGAIDTGHIVDQAVTLAKLPHGTVSTDGKFLRANNGADPTFESLPTSGISDVVSDTSPQLGGDLDTNGNHVLLDDSRQVKFGTDNDMQIYHTGGHAYIDNGTGNFYLRNTAGQILIRPNSSEDSIVAKPNGSVELYYDNSERLQTEVWGVRMFATGYDALFQIQGEENRSAEIRLLADDGDDDADYSQIFKDKDTGKLHIRNLASGSWEDNIVCANEGSVELYYDNSKKFNTANEGCVVTGGGLAVARGGSQYSGAIYFAGFGDTNHMLWQDHFDNPNGSRGTGNGWDGVKWNCYNGLRLYRGNEAENIASFNGDGACVLYHNNSQKFATTTTGIEVVNTTSPISNTGASSAANDLIVSGDGDTGITIYTTSNSSKSNIFFGDPDDVDVGSIRYLHNNNQIRFYVNGNASTPAMQWNSNLTIYFNGNMYSNGNSYSTGSDLRLKSNLVRFTNTLDKLKQIVGYQFDIKCGANRDSTRKSAGVIAQDVEKVYPELVDEVEGYKHLEYSAFTGILVEAVKELTTKIETLETKVAALEAA